MLSSLKVGVAAALSADVGKIAFGPVDAPLGGPEALRTLMGAAVATPVVLPVFEGRRGHPALIDAAVGRALLNAAHTLTPRDVLASFEIAEVEVVDPGVVSNINTATDLDRWRRESREHE